jgi:hypothetical protein
MNPKRTEALFAARMGAAAIAKSPVLAARFSPPCQFVDAPNYPHYSW